MFLPETNNNRRGSIEYANNNLGVMKKNMPSPYMSNEGHFQYINNLQNTQSNLGQNNMGGLGNRNLGLE